MRDLENKGVYLAKPNVYTASMTKRLVEIDDDLLAQARSAAGTDTIKATVETALQRLVDHGTALRHVARLRKPGALDLERLSEARRPRTGTSG
jgi:Arc/MetJ family transcription regulator